ncbi:MAG: D-hexose-6-phosphate mutarotase [Betaproteobacteria bacterium]|nr:D-hexose-6-phosphate mutarotase [Betaproteobacteria bacterium]
MNHLETLNSRFAIAGQLRFDHAGDGLIVAEIANAHASATLCLQGGHVMTWKPATAGAPVVWLSKLAKLAPGKSIRGGAPVCWPWFGAHATEAGFPGHGPARTVPWEVTGTRTLNDGSTEIALAMVDSDAIRAMWPHPGRAELLVNVGQTLKIALTTRNLGDSDFVIGEALHTYFQIGDIAGTRVLGLEGCAYLDKAGGNVRQRQEGAIAFGGETDRVYVDTEAECVIEDARLKRRIRIAKSGSRSTVVWTPWAEKADKMGDFGSGGWREMVCVESANALENCVTVKAGGSHTMAVEYRVEAMM